MDHRDAVDLHEMDRSSLFHPVTSIADQMRNGPAIYSEASGVHIRTIDGRELIDMGAGLWCVNVGYGRDELVSAAANAMKQLSFQHLFGAAASEPAIRLADRLLNLFRDKAMAPAMARVFFGTSGSDANDTAYKLVRYYKQPTRPTREEEGHLPPRQLSRRHECQRQPDRHPCVSQVVRSADRRRSAHVLPSLLRIFLIRTRAETDFTRTEWLPIWRR